MPIIQRQRRLLDSAIDHWHRWFGFNPGNRPFYPQNQLVYSYSGRSSIDLTQPQTSLGDISGELGWYPLDDAHRTISLWGGLEAPTGSVAKLTGDGAWDGAVWVHGAWRWPQWQLAAELGLAQPFGDEIFSGAAHRTSLFARFAATRALGSAWSLRAQLDGQTGRVEDSDLRFLGPSLQLTVGAIRRLRRRWRIEIWLRRRCRREHRSRHHFLSWDSPPKQCKIAPRSNFAISKGRPMYKTKIDLSEKVRRNVVVILNDRLADAIDLQSQVKQAHWNVKGPNFIALHELFDKISDVVLEQIDEIAERVTSLGRHRRRHRRGRRQAQQAEELSLEHHRRQGSSVLFIDAAVGLRQGGARGD